MGTLIRSPDAKTVTCDVRGKNSHHNSFGKVLLLLIFKSDERASNNQKQNTVTLPRGAGASSSSKRNKWGVAHRGDSVYAGFELELAGAACYRVPAKHVILVP